jgi:uncharacterized coiled-coil protein SlyX
MDFTQIEERLAEIETAVDAASQDLSLEEVAELLAGLRDSVNTRIEAIASDIARKG